MHLYSQKSRITSALVALDGKGVFQTKRRHVIVFETLMRWNGFCEVGVKLIPDPRANRVVGYQQRSRAPVRGVARAAVEYLSD